MCQLSPFGLSRSLVIHLKVTILEYADAEKCGRGIQRGTDDQKIRSVANP